jgi:hypothetical protein
MADKLRQRLEDVAMPREEAERVLLKWAHVDPNRIVWHLDELARLTVQGKVEKPLAWLRAGLKKDYRPQTSLFEKEERRRQRRRDAERDTAGRGIDNGMVPVGDVIKKLGATIGKKTEEVS